MRNSRTAFHFTRFLMFTGMAALAPGGFILLNTLKDAPDEYQLHWFRPGSPRTGETALLRFKPGDAAAPSIYDNDNWPGTSGAYNTARGIVLWKNTSSTGFWFIPYSEMDDYLKQVKQNPGATAHGAESGGNGS